MSGPTDSDLEALLRQFQNSDARELHVRTDDFELFLSKDPASPAPWDGSRPAGQPVAKAASSTGQSTKSEAPPEASEIVPEAPEELPDGHEIIRAPYLGTFYRSPKPGEPHFVEVGDEISAGKDLCLVEVMKLFTAVRSEISGVVRAIYAEDGQMVEEGQPLFAIELAG